MTEGHPHERHWYLNVVSTLPSRQGQGLGSAVLEPVLDDADDNGWPCYLESSNPGNNHRYARLGFATVGEFHPPGSESLPVTTMWREAR